MRDSYCKFASHFAKFTKFCISPGADILRFADVTLGWQRIDFLKLGILTSLGFTVSQEFRLSDYSLLNHNLPPDLSANIWL